MDIERVKAAALERCNQLCRWESVATILLVLIAAQPFGSLVTADKTVTGTLHDVVTNADLLANNPFFRLALLPVAVLIFERGVRRAITEKRNISEQAEQERQRDLALPILIEKRRIASDELEKLEEHIERIAETHRQQAARLVTMRAGPPGEVNYLGFQGPKLAMEGAIRDLRLDSINLPVFQHVFEQNCKQELHRHHAGARGVQFDPNNAHNKLWLDVFETDLAAVQRHLTALYAIRDQARQAKGQMNQQVQQMVANQW